MTDHETFHLVKVEVMPGQKFQIRGLTDEGALERPEGGGADVEVVGVGDVGGALVIEDEEGDADLADNAPGRALAQLGVPLPPAVEEAARAGGGHKITISAMHFILAQQ